MGISRLLQALFRPKRWRPAVAPQDSPAALGLSYLAFKDLTTANDRLLEAIADVERRLDGASYFGPSYVRLRAVECASLAYRMVLALDRLSLRRYQELHLVFSHVQKAMEGPIAKTAAREAVSVPFTCALAFVDARLSQAVGGKAARVGELKNRAGLPVPDGFVISTAAFRAVLAQDGLGEEIRALVAAPGSEEPGAVEELSGQVQRLVSGCTLPPEIVDAMDAEFGRLRARGGGARISVRSSAVGEDGFVSFAGQYASVLNVPPPQLADAYRQVVAALYSPSALHYRRLHGIADEDVAMAALCMPMVDGAASGVACSFDPGRPGSDTILISASWGIGSAAVGGSVSPDLWSISRGTGLPVVGTSLGRKDTRVLPLPVSGVAAFEVPAEARGRLCLSEEQAREVARLALKVEQHYGAPQEVEWALDRDGRVLLLQARQLRLPPRRDGPGLVVDSASHPVLLRGACASSGCGSGPVWRLKEPGQLAAFPDGAVLVARHSSPSLVPLMTRASAIVTDIGAATGHMASLAREFGVPAVLDTGNAMSTLADGQVITVCAGEGLVYEGRVEELLSRPGAPPSPPPDFPALALLRDVARHIVPLNLTDPGSPGFSPRACRTLHDLARFAHEKAFEEMFLLSDRVADVTQRAALLEARLPFRLHVIDIGGGLARVAASVTPADVRSSAMAALLEGMLHPDLRWWEPRPISITGFFAVAAESMIGVDADAAQRELGDRSYAIVAESYCNFSSRIGYHFAAVDAFCCDSPSRNYVSFRFKGGAADAPRRAMRCEMISAVLRRMDFGVECTGDLVVARLRKYPRAETAGRLDMLGRLIVATRQLDMRMAPGQPLDFFVRAFFEGNYQFEPGSGQET